MIDFWMNERINVATTVFNTGFQGKDILLSFLHMTSAIYCVLEKKCCFILCYSFYLKYDALFVEFI